MTLDMIVPRIDLESCLSVLDGIRVINAES